MSESHQVFMDELLNRATFRADTLLKQGEVAREKIAQLCASLLGPLAEFDRTMREIGGCSDGYCSVTGAATGMHTNGGCRCSHNRMTAERTMRAARRLRDALDKVTGE